jgi:hypothetical protein
MDFIVYYDSGIAKWRVEIIESSGRSDYYSLKATNKADAMREATDICSMEEWD